MNHAVQLIEGELKALDAKRETLAEELANAARRADELRSEIADRAEKSAALRAALLKLNEPAMVPVPQPAKINPVTPARKPAKA